MGWVSISIILQGPFKSIEDELKIAKEQFHSIISTSFDGPVNTDINDIKYMIASARE